MDTKSGAFRIEEDNPKVEDEKQKSFSESTSRHQRVFQSGRSESHGIVFWLTVALSQIIGVICIILSIYWGSTYGGYSFTDANLMFNYHPVFMVLGLIVFYGDAIIVYRVLSFLPKWILKIIHAALHISAIVFSSIALIAVFENHRKLIRPDLYSLHSWIGIAAFAAFCLQYIGSFVTFLFPGLPANWRSKVMPFHTFFGIGIFVMAAAAAGMGITEKLIWTKDYSLLVSQGVIGNVLGLLILVFVFLIIFIATHTDYKRKPLPSEIPHTSMN